jgi:hypothetical protein
MRTSGEARLHRKSATRALWPGRPTHRIELNAVRGFEDINPPERQLLLFFITQPSLVYQNMQLVDGCPVPRSPSPKHRPHR